MKTTFDKTVYYPNEEATATAKINNKDCQLAVSEVKFCLKMELELSIEKTFGGHRYNNTYTYCKS